MKIKLVKHPWRSIKFKFYKKFYYKNAKHFRELVDTDIRKAIDVKWLITYGKKFPWDRPVTLNEKITWLSGMTDTSEWTKLADKYEVRSHIKNLGLDKILIECYGVWEDVEDIDWKALPSKFAIKCTHDCGSTIIVNDKDKLDVEETKEFLKKHMQMQAGYRTCEPHYLRIKPRVMAEKLLPLPEDGISRTLIDYKIWCLDGKATVAFVCYDRHLDSVKDGGRTVYDLYDVKNWRPIRQYLTEDYKNVVFKNIPRPQNLDEMITVAETLAKGFPQVRVDLYNVNGAIYFGELTFTSQGGRMSYFTPELQKILGEAITLPSK